jgi:hypothetical protein
MNMKQIALVLMLSAAAIGCRTYSSAVERTETRLDGTTVTTTCESHTVAAPFGKVDSEAVKWKLTSSADGKIIASAGQDAAGIDNTGQVQAMQAVMEAVVKMVGILVPPVPKPVAVAPAAPSATVVAK